MASPLGPIMVQTRANLRESMAHRPSVDRVLPTPRKLVRESPEQCIFGTHVKYTQTQPAGVEKVPCLLSKWALQRMCSDMLSHSLCPREETEPFKHHWVCEVDLKHGAKGEILRPKQEGYRLEVRAGPPTVVRIHADTCWGVINAFSTLRQLIRIDLQANHTVGYTEGEFTAEDSPRHRHRGVMLHTIDTFVPLPKVRQVLNVMSLYKMNVLHFPVRKLQNHVLTNSTAVSNKYTLRDDISNIKKYAYRRGIDLLIEYNHDTRDLREYNSKLRQVHLLCPTNIPMWHLGGDEGFRDVHRHVLDTLHDQMPADEHEQACQDIQRHMVSVNKTLEDEGKQAPALPSIEDVRKSLDTSLKHSYELLKSQQIVLWARVRRQLSDDDLARWPHLVLQGAPGEVGGHPLDRCILTPREWHIDHQDQVIPSASAASLAGVALPEGALGGEVCFWQPFTPSFTKVCALVAQTLWAGSHPEPALTDDALDSISAYVVQMWKPVTHIKGHAMDARNMEGVDEEFMSMIHRAKTKMQEQARASSGDGDGASAQ